LLVCHLVETFSYPYTVSFVGLPTVKNRVKWPRFFKLTLALCLMFLSIGHLVAKGLWMWLYRAYKSLGIDSPLKHFYDEFWPFFVSFESLNKEVSFESCARNRCP
jgi:hypothetical protein